MPKNKPRRLWLKIKYSAPGASKKQVMKRLIQSIRQGDYDYPDNWRVAIGWSNKQDGALKWGEWTREMIQSAQSSEGWDIAVMQYLESQL